MDPVKFLDENIPFDENKLAFLDNIINVFFHTKNATDVIINLFSARQPNKS